MRFRLEWRTGSLVSPNPPLELTLLRGPEIVAILKAGFGLIAFLVYRCGATQRQSVGHHVSSQLRGGGSRWPKSWCSITRRA
jgi:hypothetical protein